MRKGPRRQRPKRTVVPPYDPVDLARAIESSSHRPTDEPPFDPNAYARIVDDTVVAATSMQPIPLVTRRDTPGSVTPTAPAVERTIPVPGDGNLEDLARAMYASYLESSFPEALVLAEHVIAKYPEHALAQAVIARCRSVLGDPGLERRLEPSSVVRLRPGAEASAHRVDARSLVVLAHIDGEIDAATVAELAGISRMEALEHLHTLLDEGILEVVA
jgi:hypothetical protein